MNPTTDPLILRKLEAFSRRRRRLIVIRGFCAAVATLLGAMMLIALLDWLLPLPDWMRWTLSLAAYGAIVFVEWRSCLRLLVRTLDQRMLARLVETAEPKLREDLLSAVELGDPANSSPWDSERFRELLQTDVAGRMRDLEIDRILPMNLLKPYTRVAAGIIAAVAILVAVTGLDFGSLMLRAMLPMANIERPSKVKVRIIEPDPADTIVAQGDLVPLVVEIANGDPGKATLETFSTSAGSERIAMSRTGQNRFSANIQAAREPITYRILAADAITRRHLLSPAPRPHVVKFQKTYTFPAYTQREPLRVTGENGDLAGLEGAQVDLVLKTNQAVRDAELRIEREKGAVETIKLTAEKPNLLRATLPLTASGSYRVHLVGAETGFQNKFSPEYEIRADPDLVPTVELESPKKDLLLTPNELVQLKATAKDDLGLKSVSQVIRVNDGEWQEVPLLKNPGLETVVERKWDLYGQGFRAGDLLTTKLVAIDLKGNRGESRPLLVTISAAGFDQRRLQTLESLRGFYKQVAELRRAVEMVRQQAGENRAQIRRSAGDESRRKQALAANTTALGDAEQKAAAVWDNLSEALRAAPAGHGSADLALAGRILARVNLDGLQAARVLYGALATEPGSAPAGDSAREADAALDRAANLMRIVDEQYRVLLAAEETDVLSENVQILRREQERLRKFAAQPAATQQARDQLISRVRLAASETSAFEQEIASAARRTESVSGDVRGRLLKLQNDLNKRRVEIEKVLGAPSDTTALAGPLGALAKTAGEAGEALPGLSRQLHAKAGTARQTLTREAEVLYLAVPQLKGDLERLAANGRLGEDMRRRLSDSRWDAKLGLFKARSDIEELRANADTAFASDMTQTRLALDSLREHAEMLERSELSAKLAEVERIFRTLESGHGIAAEVSGLRHLSRQERWEVAATTARTVHVQDWSALRGRFETLANELRAAGVANEVTSIVGQARDSEPARAIQREMEGRYNPQREPDGVPAELEKLAALLARAEELMREPMIDARGRLAALSPKLSETMERLARTAGELKKTTDDLAQKAGDPQQPPQSAEVQAGASGTLEAQQRMNRQIAALRDALRADANKQDAMTAAGRDRARDADDALAMLREPPPRAEQALQDAAASPEAAAQEQALQTAGAEQGKLAQALDQLAQHYKALEQGAPPQQTRTALRNSESENGVKEMLDAQYAQAEQLANLASSSPEEMLAKLEAALPLNPIMQRELDSISANTLASAAGNLDDAGRKESEVNQRVESIAAAEQARQAQGNPDSAINPQMQQPGAPPGQQTAAPAPQPGQPSRAAQSAQPAESTQGQMARSGQQGTQPGSPAQAVPQGQEPPQAGQQPPRDPALAQAAQQQGPIGDMVADAGNEIARAGRHEQRLGNSPAGQALEQLGNEVMATAEKQIPSAQDALNAAQTARQAQPAVSAANQAIQEALWKLAEEAGRAAASQPRRTPQAMEAGPRQPFPQSGQPGEEPQSGQQAQPSQMQLSGASQKKIGEPGQPDQAGQRTAAGKPGMTGEQGTDGQPQGRSGQMAQTGQQGRPPQPGQSNQQGKSAQSGQGAQPGQSGRQPQAGQTAQSGESAQPSQTTQSAKPPATGPASPQEQVWMARALDSLDAALFAAAMPAKSGQPAEPGEASQAGQPGQQGQPGQSSQPGQPGQTAGQTAQSGKPGQQSQAGQPGQPGQSAQSGQAGQSGQPGQPAPGSAEALAQSASAMAAAAQAQAASMRTDRAMGNNSSNKPGAPVGQGESSKSLGGATAQAGKVAYGALPDASALRSGDWGKLPPKLAKDLMEGQRENVSGEYRQAVETYYRVIAEKAKKER